MQHIQKTPLFFTPFVSHFRTSTYTKAWFTQRMRNSKILDLKKSILLAKKSIQTLASDLVCLKIPKDAESLGLIFHSNSSFSVTTSQIFPIMVSIATFSMERFSMDISLTLLFPWKSRYNRAAKLILNNLLFQILFYPYKLSRRSASCIFSLVSKTSRPLQLKQSWKLKHDIRLKWQKVLVKKIVSRIQNLCFYRKIN